MKKLTILFLLLITIPVFISASEYGSMCITNNSIDQGDLGDADTWYRVTGFNEMITSDDWSFSSNELIGDADCAGKYLIKFSLSFKAAPGLWEIALDVNGTKYGIIERRISSSSDIGNASGCCFVDVGNSQSAALYVKVDDDPTSFTPIHSQVVVVEMCQATIPYYGEMGVSDNTSSQTLSTSWTTITNYNSTYANLAGWTFGSDLLTDETGTSGDYLAILSISFSGATAADYEFGLSKDNADPFGGGDDTEIVLKRTIATGKTNDIGNTCACGIINMSNGSNLRIKGRTSSNYDMTISESNLTLVKLDGTNSTPYASMVIKNDHENLTLSQGIWTKEPDFNDGLRDASYWQFSEVNDNLTPINLSAGYYLLNFFLSILAEGGGANDEFDTYCAVYNNGSQIADATVVRQLQKKTGDERDVGAASGTAIIPVDNPNVSLDLRLYQNDITSIDVDIVYSSVDLFRIATINGGTLPVELSIFTGQCINSKPTLYWTTQSETDNLGWNVYRNSANDFTSADKVNDELIPGHGTTTQLSSYVYEDLSEVVPGHDYWYWLESIDYSGIINHYDSYAFIHIPTIHNPDTHSAIPRKYGLIAGPNPFNNNLTVSYMLPKTDMVKVEIYNLYGQLIAEFNEGLRSADREYEVNWDGKNLYGDDVASGVLLIKLITTEGSETAKAILLR